MRGLRLQFRGGSGGQSEFFCRCGQSSPKRNKYRSPTLYFFEAVERGVLLGKTVIDTIDFFQTQIKQCTDSATRSVNKADREFWLKMANRWQGLLQARQTRGADTGFVQRFSFHRQRFEKRRRTALAQRRH